MTPCTLPRRSFVAALGALTVSPAIVSAETDPGQMIRVPEKSGAPGREARIQLHAEALLALIRGEFTEEATSLCVIVNSDWGPVGGTQGEASINARAMSAVWEDDDRLKGGGLWIGNSLGHWAPGVGRY